MQDIKNVAILGAGAMGAYFATQFYNTPGLTTHLVAGGERLARLKQDGLLVNGQLYRIPAIDPAEATAPADLVIVALKHHHLAEATAGLEKLVGPETTFISVMNGLESEEFLARFFGAEKVLYAISTGIDALRQGNRISFTRPGLHQFGEARNDTISPRVRRVQLAFEQAGIAYQTPPDMIRKLWWKFMINVGVNQASAVMNAPYRVFQTNPEGSALMISLMQEVLSLARAAGVDLTQQDIEDWPPILNRLSPEGKTSMLQDIEAGRKTEVEVFGGKVLSLGRTYGIPTPVNQAVVQIIHVLEQQFP